MAIVYCTHNKINGKKYIGSHSANNPNYLGSGFRLKIAVKKHNKENFERVTLWEGSEEFKQEMEEYWSVGGYTSKPVHQFDLNNNYI